MTHYYKRWCPAGCGKTCEKSDFHPGKGQTAEYKCKECNKVWTKEQMKVLNNMQTWRK